MGSLMGRTFFRRLYLRIRQGLASKKRRQVLEDQYHLKTAQEAAELMGGMKGMYMKLGQIISFATDAMPEPAQEAMRSLQKDAPPMSFELARGVIEGDLGGDLGQWFSHVEEEPIAAASIGQVHKATLLDGQVVALKVQYPGVADAMRNDLKFTGSIAGLVSMVHKNADSMGIANELRDRLVEELDYTIEAKNQQRFGEIWSGHPYIRIPRVFSELCTGRVQCQEFKEGLTLYEVVEIGRPEEKRFAALVMNDFVFDTMHYYKMFNGDPHPGNYLFQEDGGVAFLDFGCVKHFEPLFIQQMQSFNRAIVNEDMEAFDESIMALQLVLPGRAYDRERMWRFFTYHAEPFRFDREFEFTAEWVAASSQVMTPDELRRFNLPPQMVFFNRITFGLNAIFAKLGARANFHRLYRRYMYPEENVAPAIASVGAALPQRFIDVPAMD